MSEGTVEELQERVHQLEENLRKVKSLDELTGLYNRNTYYDRVRCRFENEPDKEYVIVCLMSRNSNLSMTDSVLSKVTDFLAI